LFVFRGYTLASVAILVALTCDARAARIAIDPDQFPVGTDISFAFPGVALSTHVTDLGGGGATAQVFSRQSAHASTGTRVFGNSAYSELWFADNAEFRAEFIRPTNFVSLDLIADDDFDPAVLRAYGTAGNLLAEAFASGSAGTGVAETARVSRASADIAYIVATNPTGIQGQQFLIDRLVYESKPLFSTAIMDHRSPSLEGIAADYWTLPVQASEHVAEPTTSALLGGGILAIALWSVAFRPATLRIGHRKEERRNA
jgi:hypothetical protein